MMRWVKGQFSIAIKVAAAKDVIYHLYGSHNGKLEVMPGNGSHQGSQERVLARRFVRSYVLPTAKRASSLLRFVFPMFVVRNEFLKQGR